MDDLKRNRQRRIRQHYERVRTTKPDCPYCPACPFDGENDPRMFERHHIFGERSGDEVHVICKNHHAILTDNQIDLPDPVFDPPNEFDRLVLALANSAEMFELMAQAFRKHSQWLFDWHQKSVPPDEGPGKSENHDSKLGDKNP
jgi:hypothetical protein